MGWCRRCRCPCHPVRTVGGGVKDGDGHDNPAADVNFCKCSATLANHIKTLLFCTAVMTKSAKETMQGRELTSPCPSFWYSHEENRAEIADNSRVKV